jgi:hypothetical protein
MQLKAAWGIVRTAVDALAPQLLPESWSRTDLGSVLELFKVQHLIIFSSPSKHRTRQLDSHASSTSRSIAGAVTLFHPPSTIITPAAEQ